MKRAAAILLAMIMSILYAAGWAEEEPEYQTLYVVCKPSSFVNVRAYPKKKGDEVGRLECGDQILTLGERRGQYVKIYGWTFESQDCWVHGGYLTEDEPEIWPEGKEYVIRAGGRVAVRRYMRGKRRVWIYPGKTVKVYAMTREWALTNRGYIKTEFLEEKAQEDNKARTADYYAKAA